MTQLSLISFLQQYQISATDMLEKLKVSSEQDIDLALILKSKSISLQANSFDLNTLFLFWGGLAQNQMDSKAQDIIYHALLLYAANANDKIAQTCYGAIELYKLLEHLPGLEVYLQTLAHTQQSAVLIYTENAHYIYDPVKDPLHLFSIDEYQMSPTEKPFQITDPMLLAYEALKEKFLHTLDLSPTSKMSTKINK